MTDINLGLIVAASENNAIGKDQKFPWSDTLGRLKGDLPRFVGITKGSALIMGRKTYESVPVKFRRFPGRFPIVVTRKESVEPKVEIARSIDEALEIAKNNGYLWAWLGGGARIYEEGLDRPELSRLEITRVRGNFEADTYFPEIDFSQWKLVAEEVESGVDTHKYLSYVRR